CDAMTQDITCCYDDQDVYDSARLMMEKRVRRLPVLNRANELVGIVSLGDLVTDAGDQARPGEVLKSGSKPSGPGERRLVAPGTSVADVLPVLFSVPATAVHGAPRGVGRRGSRGAEFRTPLPGREMTREAQESQG